MPMTRNFNHNRMDLNRRHFLKMATAGSIPFLMQFPSLATIQDSQLQDDIFALLLQWCDALLPLQIDAPDDPVHHGMLRCPACGETAHGRCADAAYPLLTLARLTGRESYRQAAFRLIDWMKNIDQPDGSWTNELDPKSWKGITVFGSIALAHALKYNRSIIPNDLQQKWLDRLSRSGQFVFDNFTVDYANINYGMTAPYCLALLGRMLNRPQWQARARELAHQALDYFSQPSHLIFGEGRPANKRSPQQCLPIDLGYNIEESLPTLLHYAHLENDDTVRHTVIQSIASHLQFMLPDGAWDNSWGTRNFKWTWWGSRTSDGCLAALLSESTDNPAFYTAAQRHLSLLRQCTHKGLLMGGPHLALHNLPACAHHTFCHAKVLAEILDSGIPQPPATLPPLPREQADGIIHFPENATWLAARGPWRATITSYDWLYKSNVFHATGGALSLLWHPLTGPIFTASLADYIPVEAHNMQPPPEAGNFTLTPRLEATIDNNRFSNIYDLNAQITSTDQSGQIQFNIQTQLKDAKANADNARCNLRYSINIDSVKFEATAISLPTSLAEIRLILPVISAISEPIQRLSSNIISIRKPSATLKIQSSAPIQIDSPLTSRRFNLIPGFQTIPLSCALPDNPSQSLKITISVET